jgi:hypothetical protein
MEIDLKNVRDASSWLCKKKERKKERVGGGTWRFTHIPAKLDR